VIFAESPFPDLWRRPGLERMRLSLPKLTNSISILRVANSPGQLLLNRRQQQHHFRGDDRERITSARQAAEALFTPKQQVTEQSVLDHPLPSADPLARTPRVLPILSTIRREAVEAPVSSKQQTTPEIPVAKFARIRALVKYGMTVSQVAEVYRVPVDAIERILREA
jgi:hypothetical protein